AGPGLELDLDHAEQPRDERLLEADVLDPLIGYRTCGAIEQAPFDANVAVADPVTEVAPGDPAEQERQSDRGHYRRKDVNHAALPALRSEQCRGRRQQQVAQVHDRADDIAERARPPPFPGRGARRFAHIVSRFTCARISSRIAIASSWPRPGSETEALWFPAVCSTSVPSP